MKGRMKRERLFFVFLAVMAYFSVFITAQTDQPITCKQGNYFVQNLGQLSPDILYYSDIPQGRLYVRQNDIVFQFIEHPLKEENDVIARFSQKHGLRSDLPYPEECPRKISNVYVTFPESCFFAIIPEDEQVTKINIFKGNDPNKWRTDIPTFGAIRIENLYENVDLVIGGERNNPEAPIWHLEGDANHFEALKMSVDTNLPVGRAIIPVPEEKKNTETMERTKLLPHTEGQELLWGTYLGGESLDEPYDVSSDSSDNVIVTGLTFSYDLPAPNGYSQFNNGKLDFYLAKISSSGNYLLWATYIGGSDYDNGHALGVDRVGNIVVAGHTKSSDIPVPNGLYLSLIDPSYYDIYIAKLSSEGNSLLWATYLGGSYEDRVYSLCFDSSDNVIVAGYTKSPNIPVPGGYDETINSLGDIYVAKISVSGDSLMWGTFIGGQYFECAGEIVADSDDAIIIAGYTSSSDIPVPNAYDKTYNGGDSDMYVAKLASSGNSLEWATFIGGAAADYANAASLDSSGNILITGPTESSDIPVPKGYDGTYNDTENEDIYVAKLSSQGDSLLWGTYIGGSNVDVACGLCVDSADNVIVVGYTASENIPVPGGYSQAIAGASDIYVAKISSSGSSLVWGTYLGGGVGDEAWSVSLDNFGRPVIGAITSSSSIPVPGGYDQTFNGYEDIYLAKLSDVAAPPPSIGNVIKKGNPFRLLINGSNFHSDGQVFIGEDTVPWSSVSYKNENLLVLKGGNSLKAKIPKGVPVEIKVVNGDGGSATITYTR
jgi:hypothetical protein